MILNKELLLDIFDKNSFGWVKVYDSEGDKIYSDSNKDKEALKTKLLDFICICSENLRIEFKKSETDSADSIFKYKYRCERETKEAKQFQGVPQQVDISKIEKEIEAKILARQEEKEKAKELANLKKEYETKMAAMEDWGTRLSMLLELGFSKIAKKYEPVINGLLGNQSMALAGIPETNEIMTEEIELSEIEQKQLAEAMNVLLQHLSVTQICTLVKNVQAKPELLQTLKTFNLI